MKVEITTKPIVLEYNSKKAVLKKPLIPENILDMRTEKGQLDITTQKGQLNIDQSQCFNESGLKDNNAFMNDCINYSNIKFSDGVNRIVSQGNQMMNIQNSGDAVVNQSDYNGFDMFKSEYNLGFIPSGRPKINYKPAKVNINYKPTKVINNSKLERSYGEYRPGKLNIYVSQMNSIKIQVVRDKFDKYI